MSIVETFFKYFVIIMIYIFLKVYGTNYLEEKQYLKFFEKNNYYYRDIIKNYSPAVLSYIDDFELNYPKDIIAVLLKLREDGKIENFDVKLENTNTIDCNYCTNSEDLILNNFKNNTLNLCFERLKTIIKNEAISLELIETCETIKKKNKSKIKKYLIAYGISIIIFIACVFLKKYLFTDGFDFLFFIIYGGALVFTIVPILLFSLTIPLFKNSNAYKRTKKGEEIHKNLEGLKNYLKDFSNMNDKEMNQIKLWNDYLIYSVIFDQNKKVIEECTKSLFYM